MSVTEVKDYIDIFKNLFTGLAFIAAGGYFRILGRPTASQVASASLPSFFESCDTVPRSAPS